MAITVVKLIVLVIKELAIDSLRVLMHINVRSVIDHMTYTRGDYGREPVVKEKIALCVYGQLFIDVPFVLG